MKRILSLPALAAFALLGASCSQQVRPVKKTARPPVYVGKVEQVYPSHNYVLIALAGNVYEPGTVLISQSPGREENRRVANLIVTEERMGRARIPADIRSGAVEAGDLVFLYRNLAAPESSGKRITRTRTIRNRGRMKTARRSPRRFPRTAAKRRTGCCRCPGRPPRRTPRTRSAFPVSGRKSSGSWKAFRASWMTRGARLFPENRQENDFLDSFNKSLFFGKPGLG